ncbi:hypothetical protein M011DRAFT_477778 [Sporormia fimetaria CBS 119925]|uniref:Uncharacterized protein n=1 Tax=Sporormia fimetaria CBS 119925 TaxID=1340428 RepID=A0A6A6VCW3_9PLEO|nr:hypothetical protein M011DRAFT_477778 [Sporormia fimetaria CBS 119925]
MAPTTRPHREVDYSYVPPTYQKASKVEKPKPKKKATKATTTPTTKTTTKSTKSAPPSTKATTKSSTKSTRKPKSTPKKPASPEPVPHTPPKNPQATLTSLPAELRIHIYSHLLSNSLIHVHHHKDEDDDNVPSRFTWTACRGTNPRSDLLCANPKWSGFSKEANRCTVKKKKPQDPTGFAALMNTCKGFRHELNHYMLRNVTVSVMVKDVIDFINHLEAKAPSQIKEITRLTLCGPHAHLSYRLEKVRDSFPNLKAVAFQGQVPHAFHDYIFPNEPPLKWLEGWWHFEEFTKIPRHIDVAIEAMSWNEECSNSHGWIGYPRYSWGRKLTVFEILRPGKEGEVEKGSGWGREDRQVVERTLFEGPATPDGQHIISNGPRAAWKSWWRGYDIEQQLRSWV